jgi:peptidoglycan hydrolase-like protein with peptidoglycan-binding domain
MVSCVPLANAAATTSVGATELKKEITAERARLAQLKLKPRPQPTPGITRTLKRGASGEEVLLLQQFLKLYGTSSAPMATGYFGTQTKKAVKEFQRNESIDPVGIVGPKTRARILALSSRELILEKARTATSSSDALPAIANVIFTTEVGEDGSGVGSTTVFASTTKNIYAILSLTNAKQDTQIGLIRYYKDTYIDSEVTHPSRSGLRYTHFQWSLKADASRIPGPYTITFYVDGKKSKTASFTVN